MKDKRLEEAYGALAPYYPPTTTRTLYDIKQKGEDGEILSLGHTSRGHAEMIRDIYWPDAEIVEYEAPAYEAFTEFKKGQLHIKYKRRER